SDADSGRAESEACRSSQGNKRLVESFKPRPIIDARHDGSVIFPTVLAIHKPDYLALRVFTLIAAMGCGGGAPSNNGGVTTSPPPIPPARQAKWALAWSDE